MYTMTQHEREIRYDILYEAEDDGAEAARRKAAVRKTHSLLGEWRSRFTDEVIEPQRSKEKSVTISSASPRDAVAEIMASNGARLTHELSGEEGKLVVTKYPVDGEPRVIEGDFTHQHSDLARIIFDANRELARGE
jgi:hypothetical protein